MGAPWGHLLTPHLFAHLDRVSLDEAASRQDTRGLGGGGTPGMSSHLQTDAMLTPVSQAEVLGGKYVCSKVSNHVSHASCGSGAVHAVLRLWLCNLLVSGRCCLWAPCPELPFRARPLVCTPGTSARQHLLASWSSYFRAFPFFPSPPPPWLCPTPNAHAGPRPAPDPQCEHPAL